MGIRENRGAGYMVSSLYLFQFRDVRESNGQQGRGMLSRGVGGDWWAAGGKAVEMAYSHS